MTSYKLYGVPLSLYTGKVRSYLRFKNVPFEEVFSSRKIYQNIIEPKTGLRFIPVLETPSGEFIQDTSVIIDTIESHYPKRSVVPPTPKQKLVSAILEMWGDEWLLIPAMHYRWNHDNFPFIYEEFGEIALPNMPAFLRRFVGKKLGAKFKNFVPLLGITQKTIPAIEAWYENHVLPTLDKHFATHDYLLGSRPCTGDFGLMGPLYAHLYRDPAPGKLMKEKAPNLAKWVERMNGENVTLGDWLENDSIPDTLMPLLQQQFDEFWPVQLSNLHHTQEWINANPQKKHLPRMITKHLYTIGGVKDERAVASFSQWKLQRVLDVYTAFNETQSREVDTLLSDINGLEHMNTAIEHRVKRENNLLMVE